MPSAHFIRDFDYRTPRKAVVAYKAGYEGNIPKSHHEAAEAAGVLAPRNIPVETDGAEQVHP
ncbi:hypothetical protein LUX29_18095 [Aureimonas altamirensis]|uniref:hypothetical protein n=1 Tax=Aureimonas altamirensis TaxID=370622 RepID=UPI001E61B2A5|nr:hypothetical protein [Aureimonas altamirensis]UHD44915.1 hypothetical protein LUX29_18095 [Aureimonas altamirensis]